MKTVINRACLLISLCLWFSNVSAQYTTNFSVIEVDDEEMEEIVNLTVSDLLTTFNTAQYDKKSADELKDLLLTRCTVTEESATVISKLWLDCPFTCMDEDIVEPMVKQPSGEFQIRNIHLMMKPVEGLSKDVSWKKYQEGVVTLSKEGQVVNFHLALDPELYTSVLGTAKEVDDLERRMLILEYVERFRNAYNLKDMPFLEQIYSDDALIITGRVVTTKKADIAIPQIEYKKQDKKTYLTNLARVFQNNTRINVTFNEIKVVRHPVNVDFYGVTLLQGWETSNYSDVGWLFLLWDFTDPEAPQIHVRTWQPTEFNHKPVEVDYEVFSIDDFDI